MQAVQEFARLLLKCLISYSTDVFGFFFSVLLE